MILLNIILLFLAPCLCQFVVDLGMKPDVTFGEQNDRFDVESIIQDQSRMDIGNPIENFRRQLQVLKEDVNTKETEDEKNRENKNGDGYNLNEGAKEEDEEIDKKEELVDAVKDTVHNLGIDKFAYHSNLNSGPDDDDYEKNLAVFDGKSKRRNFRDMMNFLEDVKSGRRSANFEDEVLFNYGVPVNMKIHGFLEVPLQDR